MSDQTFHTPSFGDEDFDIPVINQQPHMALAPQQESQLQQIYHQQPMHGATNDMVAMDQYQQQLYHELQTTQDHINSSATFNNQSMQQGVYAPMMSSAPDQHQMLLMQQQQQEQQQQQQQLQHQVQSTLYTQGRFQYSNNTVSLKQEMNPLNMETQQHANLATTVESTPASASEDSDDGASNQPSAPVVAKVPKARAPRKKKNRDPNEPQKPVSAYALFFRDTQAAIKGQNPTASFGEISKIVASMWDALDPEYKSVYKMKNEVAKKEYQKALATYRAGLVTNATNEDENVYKNYQDQDFQQPQYPNNPQSVQQVPQKAQILPQGNVVPPASGMTPIVPLMGVSNQVQQLPGDSLTSHGQLMQQQHNMQQPNQVEHQPHYIEHSQQVVPAPSQHQTPPLPEEVAHADEDTPSICIREGCTNPAVINPEWEDEYCSNECVVSHCRNVFDAWVLGNKELLI